MFSMAFRIRRARTAAALTQAALARRLGVQRSAVTQWESDAGTTPSVVHLAQIACETRVPFEWLATGRGPGRMEEGALDVAVVVQDYARDEMESRMLEAMRRISRRRRQAMLQFVEVLAG